MNAGLCSIVICNRAHEAVSLGTRPTKVEGGSGGRRGHSNMTHWTRTEEIKRRARKARRAQSKTLSKTPRHN